MARDLLLVGQVLGPTFVNETDPPHWLVPGGTHLQDQTVVASYIAPTTNVRTTTVAWQDVRDHLTLGNILGPVMLGAPGYDLAVPGYTMVAGSAWPVPAAEEPESVTYTRVATDYVGLSDWAINSASLVAPESVTYDRTATDYLGLNDWVSLGAVYVSQIHAGIDGATGLGRLSQTIAAIDGATGSVRFSQLHVSVDIASWYLQPRDTLELWDTVVATRIAAEAPPSEVSTTYFWQVTDALPVYDARTDWVNGIRLRRITDQLTLRDRFQPRRDAVRRAVDFLTVTDSVGDLGNYWYVGHGRLELHGESDPWRDITYQGFAEMHLFGEANTWRDYGTIGLGILGMFGTAAYRKVELVVTGVPDGYAARITLPNSTVAAQAVASMGAVALELDVSDMLTSGTLEIFQNLTCTIPALNGRIPVDGPGTLKRSNIWHYTSAPYILDTAMTSVYIERPLGGWTAPGSARADREELGYAVFTNSALSGLTRGSNGTAVATHGLAPSVVVVVKDAQGTSDVSSYLIGANAVRWRQDSVPIFVNSSDELLIGATSKFSAAHLWLAQNASERIRLAPYYSTGEGTWSSWTASSLLPPVDTTSGFTTSGYAGLEPPGDWAPSRRWASGSGTLIDSVARYWFRLVRATGSSTLVPPRLMHTALTADAVVMQRVRQPFVYTPTLQDSGQVLYFKAVARGIGGGIAPGASAPVAVVDLGG